jgi:hypothetical protein
MHATRVDIRALVPVASGEEVGLFAHFIALNLFL